MLDDRSSVFVRCCCQLCLACQLWLLSPQIQANPVSFDIPAQNLSSALLLFSYQAKLQVFYRSELAEGQLSVAVSGSLDVAEALTLLLANTDLQHRYVDDATVTLSKRETDGAIKRASIVRPEEVNVLGSLMRHSVQYDRSPPVSVIDRKSVAAEGMGSVTEISLAMPFNSGAEVRVNNLSQPLTNGTAAVNLRNLGLGSTMVLVNGHRLALSPVATTEGETFVDLHSLMPVIMMQRMEVLRGGASSSYGSDAVAGVINIIPRAEFDGLEVHAEYQQTGAGDQSDRQLEMIFGTGLVANKGHWVVAISLFKREPLATGDRDFTTGTVISGSGQPGTYRGSNDLIRDPACGVSGGIVSPRSEFCLFDSSAYFDLVPEEQRRHFYSLMDIELNPRNAMRWGLGLASAEVEVLASPSFPFTTSLPVVPTSNPGNLSNEPLLFLGRVLGADAGASTSSSDYTNLHSYLELETVFNEWSLSSMLTFSENRVRYGRQDVVKDRLQAALDGVGGNSGDQTWNPLYQAQNPPGLAASFFSDWGMRAKTRLTTIDFIGRSDWRTIWKVDYGFALGVHYRSEWLSNDFAEEFNNNQFYALGGGPDFSAIREVSSVYAELYFSWDESLELQLAGRYEDYGKSVDSLAPMLALLWRWNELLSLRASYSEAFKAPSLFQTGSDQSVPSAVFDALNPDGAGFRNVLTHGRSDLKPEQAEVFSLGVSLKHWLGVSSDLDFWYYDYRDLILKESPQQIVNAALAGDSEALEKVARDPLSNEILRIDADFINAASVETAGIDWELRFQWENTWGQWRMGSSWTYVARFDIRERPGDAVIDGVGRRNATTPAARSLPQWRSNSYIQWQYGEQQLRAVANYTDSYRDDKNNNQMINSFSTVDLHYQRNLNKVLRGVRLSASISNLFDSPPPSVDDFLGYDANSHDPRGRIFSLSANYHY